MSRAAGEIRTPERSSTPEPRSGLCVRCRHTIHGLPDKQLAILYHMASDYLTKLLWSCWKILYGQHERLDRVDIHAVAERPATACSD